MKPIQTSSEQAPSELTSSEQATSVQEMVFKRWMPSASEIELLQQLDNLEVQHMDREFLQWINHYQLALEDMYDQCVDPKLSIPYADFVYAAYMCTEVEWDSQQFKYRRPLI